VMPPPLAVMFDLGGTLVDYYERREWTEVFPACISNVAESLAARGAAIPDTAEVLRRMESIREEERVRLRDRGDWRVWPMEDRLREAFFRGAPGPDTGLMDALCREFLKPVFARARPLPEALPVLSALHARGLALAIVSNMPWGRKPAGAVDRRGEAARAGPVRPGLGHLPGRRVAQARPAHIQPRLRPAGRPPRGVLVRGRRTGLGLRGSGRRRNAPGPAGPVGKALRQGPDGHL